MDKTYSCTNLDTTYHMSTLFFFEKKVLHVLQSQGQPACLIVGLREKTTYRSTLFLSGRNRARDALQKKATKEATSKVVKETAG